MTFPNKPSGITAASCIPYHLSGIFLSILLIFSSNATCFTPQQTKQSKRVSSQLSVDKGFNLLELSNKVIPQGIVVSSAKESLKFVWKRMMAELAPQDETGSYQRPSYSFITANQKSLPDESNRYHVYVGNPCPWCHRVVMTLQLRGLNEGIGITKLVDDPIRASRGGWVIDTRDPLQCRDLREVYDTLSPGFQGRCTAPLLVDAKERRIISNESSDICRWLNTVTLGTDVSNRINLVPPELQTTIDSTNEWVYRLLNNGCYQCGFSTTQTGYDKAAANVAEGLRRVESILSRQDFLCGSTLSESDVFLLPTALRFDTYGSLFRASRLRIRDLPHTQAWLRRCWAMPGVPRTIDLPDAHASYYKQLFPLNPGGIIPTAVTASTLGLDE